MSNLTAIEWTDATWNPVRGCSRVSEGCRNCYAPELLRRAGRGPVQWRRAPLSWVRRHDP